MQDKTLDRSIPVSDDSANNFSKLGIQGATLKALTSIGFLNPTGIQSGTIPAILEGRDVLAQAQTGSGKTAAFLLPSLQRLQFNRGVEILVMVPTRELALQVVREAKRFTQGDKVKIVSVIGGESISQQVRMIQAGAQIVVATPGRLLDHIESGRFSKPLAPTTIVLDEVDEMLDMGFMPDIQKILALMPEQRQMLLFSATLPPTIERMARKELSNPFELRLSTEDRAANKDVEQSIYLVRRDDRENALLRLIETESPEKAIIFCQTKKETAVLCERLLSRGLKVQALHGDMSQSERTEVLRKLREGLTSLLIATDLASRGLDIADLTHVFNFHLPENRERYVHRVGRTGRAGRTGKAITFASMDEWGNHPMFRNFSRKDFVLKSIPTRSETETLVAQRLLADMAQVKPCVRIEADCAHLPEIEVRQLLNQLLTHMKKMRPIVGPEHIGSSPEDARRLAERTEQRGRSSSSRSSSYRGRSSAPRPWENRQRARSAHGSSSAAGQRKSR